MPRTDLSVEAVPRTAPPELPPIRQDLRLLPAGPQQDGSPAWSLYDPSRNQYFRMGRRALVMLNHWHPGQTVACLITAANADNVSIDAETITEFADFLQKNHLLVASRHEDSRRLYAGHQGRRTHLLKWLLKNYLYIRIPLFRPDRLLAGTLPWVAPLFSPWTRRLIMALGLIGLLLTLRRWEDFWGTFQHFFNFQGLVIYGLTLIGVKALHELGHAYSARRQGCRVPTMGIAFLVLYPMLYTDTTDAWRLPSHRQRLKIALAGIRVELALAMLALFAWNFLPDGPLRSAAFFITTVSLVGSLSINLSPFMRFDGYYALADWLEAENLQFRAFNLARWQLREWLLGFGVPPPESLPRPRQRLFVLYAWSTWCYRFFLFLGIALMVYHAVFKVLGILLFAVEVGWFIVLPVYREIQIWWARRHQIRLSCKRLILPLMTAVILAALLVPWQHETTLMGLLKADRFTRIYPRESGQVQAVLVTVGQTVAAGEPLLRMTSPDFDKRRAVLKVRLALLRTLMDRHMASDHDLKRLPVLQEQMAQAASDLEGLQQREARLLVRAPFAGRITFLDDLHPGQWCSPTAPVANLASEAPPQVEAYVTEDDLHRIASGARGRFLARDGLHAWIPVTVSRIDYTAVRNLAHPILASIHGGPVAVRLAPDGSLRPEKATYHISLVTTETVPPQTWMMPGAIRLKGKTDSVAGRICRHAAAVIIRETGF